MDSRGLLGKVGFGLMLLALFLAPVMGGYPSGKDYGADVVLNALRALVILACAIGTLTPPTGGRTRGQGASIAAWCLFALTTLSLLVHSRLLTSPTLLFAQLPATLDWLCYALVFTVGANATRRGGREVWYLVGAVVLGLTWAAISGAREYGQIVQAGSPEERIGGPFFDPNFQAGFLALGLPLAIAGCLAARERLLALGTGATAALAVGALAATGSRAGVGIALVGIVVTAVTAIMITAGTSRALVLKRIALLAVTLALLAFAFHRPLIARVGGSAGVGQEHSGKFRQYTWRGTVAMAKANPILGTGPGTYPYRYPAYAIVEKTGLAHSSYLQIAAEEGIPALVAAIAAIVMSLIVCARSLWGQRSREAVDTEEVAPFDIRLLYCGILGAVIVGAARSIFDSEWALLGNGLPFWAMAGLAASGWPPLTHELRDVGNRRNAILKIIALLVALGLSLDMLSNVQNRDNALQAFARGDLPTDISIWPVDPDLYFAQGREKDALEAEPSSRLYFRAGRTAASTGDLASAVVEYRKAVTLDPNNLQSWRTLAETQQQSGDADGALASYRELIQRFEGPSGTIRAIPELPEIHPAFAYAAVADALAHEGQVDQAREAYLKAAAVIEAYSQTPPLYQSVEVVMARKQNVDLDSRRKQLKELYNRVIDALIASPGTTPAAAAELKSRRSGTLDRIDHFASSLPAS